MLVVALLSRNKHIIVEWPLGLDYTDGLGLVIGLSTYDRMFLLSVVIITSSVVLYSREYMGLTDSNVSRCVKLASIFIIRILLVLSCPNIFNVILG